MTSKSELSDGDAKNVKNEMNISDDQINGTYQDVSSKYYQRLPEKVILNTI